MRLLLAIAALGISIQWAALSSKEIALPPNLALMSQSDRLASPELRTQAQQILNLAELQTMRSTNVFPDGTTGVRRDFTLEELQVLSQLLSAYQCVLSPAPQPNAIVCAAGNLDEEERLQALVKQDRAIALTDNLDILARYVKQNGINLVIRQIRQIIGYQAPWEDN